MNVGKELRRARLERGMTVRRLAEIGKTSPAAISQIETGARGVSVERVQTLLLNTGHRLVSIPTIASTPAEVSAFIKNDLDEGKPLRAYRQFIGYSDELRGLERGVRVAVTLIRPESTGNPLYDAALASLVEHWLSFDQLPIPSWVTEDAFHLSALTHLSEAPWESAPEPSEVPDAFLLHNVLFPADALESI